MCKAFIGKTVWNFDTTSGLIDAIRHRPTLRRLCGWETLGEVPSEATFSRAFDAFARETAKAERLSREINAEIEALILGKKKIGA
jgi:hypothetical protein